MISKRKNGGLKTPYRRIIFSISISDILQSFALTVGPFMLPQYVPDSWGVGNDFTCKVDGFFLTVGSSAVAMYTCLLSFYYLCKLKFRMSDEAFAMKYEQKSHRIIFLSVLIIAIVAFALGIIHPTANKSYCFFANIPTGCARYPEEVGECDAGIQQKVRIMSRLVMVGLPLSCLFGIVIFMGMLYSHAIAWKRIISNEVSNKRDKDASREMTQEINEEPDCAIEKVYESTEIEPRGDVEDRSSSNLDSEKRVLKLSALYTNEMRTQASCYVAAFVVTYIPLALAILVGRPGKALWLPHRILTYFYPLGGFFNILVYTRPEVAKLRRSCNGKMSRLTALWLVLKAGGEILDQDCNESNSHANNDHDTTDNSDDVNKISSSILPVTHVVADPEGQGQISELQMDLVANKFEADSSVPNSIGCINGRSISIIDNEVALTDQYDWIHGKAPRVWSEGLPVHTISERHNCDNEVAGENDQLDKMSVSTKTTIYSQAKDSSDRKSKDIAGRNSNNDSINGLSSQNLAGFSDDEDSQVDQKSTSTKITTLSQTKNGSNHHIEDVACSGSNKNSVESLSLQNLASYSDDGDAQIDQRYTTARMRIYSDSENDNNLDVKKVASRDSNKDRMERLSSQNLSGFSDDEDLLVGEEPTSNNTIAYFQMKNDSYRGVRKVANRDASSNKDITNGRSSQNLSGFSEDEDFQLDQKSASARTTMYSQMKNDSYRGVRKVANRESNKDSMRRLSSQNLSGFSDDENIQVNEKSTAASLKNDNEDLMSCVSKKDKMRKRTSQDLLGFSEFSCDEENSEIH